MRGQRVSPYIGPVLVAIGLLVTLPRDGLQGVAANPFSDWSPPDLAGTGIPSIHDHDWPSAARR